MGNHTSILPVALYTPHFKMPSISIPVGGYGTSMIGAAPTYGIAAPTTYAAAPTTSYARPTTSYAAPVQTIAAPVQQVVQQPVQVVQQPVVQTQQVAQTVMDPTYETVETEVPRTTMREERRTVQKQVAR